MKSLTSAEDALKSILEVLGYLVIPFDYRTDVDPANAVYMQMPIHRFTIDFGLPSVQICLEADGDRWHRSAQKKLRDRNRDIEIRKFGWYVLRFQSLVLEGYPTIAASQVKRGIEELQLV